MKKSQQQNADESKQSPRLRLNKRLKEILATGILPSLSPSAHTVLCYAVAHGSFSDCEVFLGAKTIAKRLGWHRAGARRGIRELITVGFLIPIKERTNRQATVYKIALDHERIEATRQRVAAVGAKRRKNDEQRAAESKAKKRRAKQVKKRQGAHGRAPRGLMGESPGDSWVSPQGAHGRAPKLFSNVPSPLKERMGNRPSAEAEGDAHANKQRKRLAKLRITPRQRAGAATTSEKGV